MKGGVNERAKERGDGLGVTASLRPGALPGAVAARPAHFKQPH